MKDLKILYFNFVYLICVIFSAISLLFIFYSYILYAMTSRPLTFSEITKLVRYNWLNVPSAKAYNLSRGEISINVKNARFYIVYKYQ